jgi:hypothetical protein
MPKFKVDLTVAKQFLFEKGEKVGLIGCTAIMILIVGYALYSGLMARGAPSGKSWDAEIAQGATSLDQSFGRVSLDPKDVPEEIRVDDTVWKLVPSFYSFAAMFPLPDRASTKKRNPQVLSLYGADLEKSFQVDYVRGAYYAYEIDTNAKSITIIVGGGGGGGGLNAGGNKGMMGGGGQSGANLAKIVLPTRMVVVSGVFPMWDQLEEFRKALRYATIEELLMHRDELPRPLGVEVARCEILPDGRPRLDKDGKSVLWTPLFKFDKNLKVTAASPTLRSMLQRMVIDKESPQAVAPHIFTGLVTPLPKMANALYTKLDLRGIDVRDIAAAAEDNTQPAGGNSLGPMPKGGSLGPAPKGGSMPTMPGKGGKGPGMDPDKGGGGGAGQDIRLNKASWSKAGVAKDVQDKFMLNDKFFIFHPFGQLSSSAPGTTTSSGKDSQGPRVGAADGKEMGGSAETVSAFGWDAILTGGGQGGGPMGVAPMNEGEAEGVKGVQATQLKVNPTDALVRFFDPDVQPGKTYRYSIRIRMANPNEGKKTQVESLGYADQRELDPLDAKNFGWTVTPEIAIPGDYNWYAVDQQPELKIRDGADYFAPFYRPESTAPIQVHRWMDRVSDPANNFDFLVGDWAIAERLYVRRGDPVGRERVLIEMPVWRPELQTWEIGVSVQATKAKTKLPTPKDAPLITGIPVNLIAVPPALVVDFDGGKRPSFPIEKRDGTKEYVADASAVDILVLNSDGKLVVRNTRSDADPDTYDGSQREERWRIVRDRLAELRLEASGGGGIDMPSGRSSQGPMPK